MHVLSIYGLPWLIWSIFSLRPSTHLPTFSRLMMSQCKQGGSTPRAISQAASEHIEAIKEIDGSAAIPLYLHIAKEHAPAMVMAVGSLPRWSMQPEEHLHALRKKDKARRSAHASGGEKRRGGGVVERSFLSTQFGVEWNRIISNASDPEREPIWVRAKKRRQDLLAAHLRASSQSQDDGAS